MLLSAEGLDGPLIRVCDVPSTSCWPTLQPAEGGGVRGLDSTPEECT